VPGQVLDERLVPRARPLQDDEQRRLGHDPAGEPGDDLESEDILIVEHRELATGHREHTFGRSALRRHHGMTTVERRSAPDSAAPTSWCREAARPPSPC
jgi:hypothetical protein